MPKGPLIERAREFRKAPISSEAMLRSALRGGKLGVRFHRQRVIGPFVADFACVRPRMIVEIDGPVHDDQLEHDAERQSFLEQLGFCFFRVSSDEVERQLAAVLERLRIELNRPE